MTAEKNAERSLNRGGFLGTKLKRILPDGIIYYSLKA
jgi:hypothetical protein